VLVVSVGTARESYPLRCLLVAVCLLAGMAGCRSQEPGPSAGIEVLDTRSPALARATSPQWPALTIEVVELQRPAPGVLEVKLAVVNAPTGSAFDPRAQFAADATEAGTLSGIYLMDADGQRKYFVLRDDAGRPQCSNGLGSVGPGGRIDLFARFIAPGSDVQAVTVHLPGFAPAGPVPLGGP